MTMAGEARNQLLLILRSPGKQLVEPETSRIALCRVARLGFVAAALAHLLEQGRAREYSRGR